MCEIEKQMIFYVDDITESNIIDKLVVINTIQTVLILQKVIQSNGKNKLLPSNNPNKYSKRYITHLVKRKDYIMNTMFICGNKGLRDFWHCRSNIMNLNEYIVSCDDNFLKYENFINSMKDEIKSVKAQDYLDKIRKNKADLEELTNEITIETKGRTKQLIIKMPKKG